MREREYSSVIASVLHFLLVVMKVERAVRAEALASAARLLLDARPAEFGLVEAVDAFAAVWSQAV